MRFLFNLHNHTELGRLSLLDPMLMIARQLEALGHEVVRSDDGYAIKQAINIVFEGFQSAFVEQKMRPAHAAGARFIIVATEEPTEKGFNHGVQHAMVERQQSFPEAARLAEAIWCLVPRSEPWYSQFGVPASELELGYSAAMMRVPATEPIADFGFFGSLSPRREQILKQLNRMGARIVRVHSFPPPEERDRSIAPAKVILQIRPHEQMGLVSSSRCATALFLGRPVIAEPHALSENWHRIIRFAANEQSFAFEAFSARQNWRALHAEQLRNFQRLLTPEFCVGRALRRTGLVPAQAA